MADAVAALGEAEADLVRAEGGLAGAAVARGLAAGFSGCVACFAAFLCLTALATMAISPAPSPPCHDGVKCLHSSCRRQQEAIS